MHFAGPGRPVLWEALHTRDDTFVVNQERTFQARKRDARESELLVGIERAGSVVAEPLHPIPVPEQDWLYRGRPLRRIVASLASRPAALIWTALHERMPHFPVFDQLSQQPSVF